MYSKFLHFAPLSQFGRLMPRFVIWRRRSSHTYTSKPFHNYKWEGIDMRWWLKWRSKAHIEVLWWVAWQLAQNNKKIWHLDLMLKSIFFLWELILHYFVPLLNVMLLLHTKAHSTINSMVKSYIICINSRDDLHSLILLNHNHEEYCKNH